MSIVTLPRTMKTFARLRVIAQVLSRHGFGHFVDQLHLGGILPGVGFLRRRPKVAPEPEELDPLESIGARLVKVCEELGPTFIKLGQIASTRADILPTPILEQLEHLQADVKPFPTEQARRIIEKDTGAKLADVFREMEDKPFASGSIGQVYRAVAHDGQKVIVKVKRPGIANLVRLDIYVLKFLASQAESLFPELRPYRPKLLIDEFTQALSRELDYINEASATQRFYDAFKDDPNIQTPAVRWDLTSPNVLTMEYLEGVRFRDALTDAGPACNRRLLARHLAECYLHQFFELGFFHADPHPGNLLIQPPDGVVLIDFGMIGQLDEMMKERLVIGIVAAVKREAEVIVDIMADLDCLGPDTDRLALSRDLRAFIDKYYGLPLRRLDMSTIFRELIETVRRNDVTLPRDFVALFKSLAVISGVAIQLDPELNLVELIKPRLSRLVRDRFSRSRLVRMAGVSAWHLGAVLRDAPRLLREVMRGMGRGRFQVNIKHENLDYLARELDRSSNRLAASVIMSATIIGGTMLLSMERDIEILPHVSIRWLGFIGYAIASVMAVWLVIAIMRSGKLS